jgi:hypothetical protein
MITDADPVSGTRASTTLSTFSLKLGGPFDFCAFASLSELLLGSLEIALKCTRPRQRFCFMLGGILCQRGEVVKGYFFCFSGS